MSKAEIAILCIAIFQGFCIFLGNFFTVFVFWIHRHKLKRGSILLINLAVTDLLVGLTQIAMVGTIAFPHITGVRKVSDRYTPDISTCFKAVFSTASVFFLAIISLERAFALMWPLRHRATSTSTYIYSVLLVWTAAITVGVSCLLVVLGILKYRFFMALSSVVIILCLITVSLSYLFRQKVREGSYVSGSKTAKCSRPEAVGYSLPQTLFQTISFAFLFLIDR